MNRVLINVRNLSLPHTGVQRYTRELLAHLGDLLHPIGHQSNLQGIFGQSWEQFLLPAQLHGRLLFSPDTTGPLLVCRQVITVHDMAIFDFWDRYSDRSFYWQRWLLPRLISRVAGVIVNSNFTRDRLVAIFDVDPARVNVIHPGVSSLFSPRAASEPLDAQYQLPPGRPYLLSVSDLGSRNNLVGLLEAWKSAQCRLDPALVLILVDTGNTPTDFPKTRLTLPPRTAIIDHIDEVNLSRLVAGALGFLYPSLYEGFGLPPLEAMASSVPVLASNTTALPEILGDAALLVDPHVVSDIAQGIVRLVDDSSLRDRLKTRGLIVAGSYTWRACAQSTREVLQSLTNEDSGSKSCSVPARPVRAELGHVAIDARMVEHSGIGVYLTAIACHLTANHPGTQFSLLGNPEHLARNGLSNHANVHVVPWLDDVYSPVAHLLGPPRLAAKCNLYWSPHYVHPLRIGAPLLATVHDLFHLAMPELIGGPHRHAFARYLFASLARRSDGLLFDSEFSRGEFVRFIGEPRCRNWIIHPGVSSSWFATPTPAPAPRPYLIFVGSVKPHKNLQALLAALDLLGKEAPDLLIVGQSKGLMSPDRRIIALADRDNGRVRFTGRLTNDEVRTAVAGALALVFPSLYEGFGLPPIEAMACGVPAIVSDIPPCREVCRDGALYVDPRDPRTIAAAVRIVQRDQATCSALIARGREVARRYTWSASADRVWHAMLTLARTVE